MLNHRHLRLSPTFITNFYRRFQESKITISVAVGNERQIPGHLFQGCPSYSYCSASSIKRAPALLARQENERSFSSFCSSAESLHANSKPAIKLSREVCSLMESCASMIRSTSLRSGFSRAAINALWHSSTSFSCSSSSGRT